MSHNEKPRSPLFAISCAALLLLFLCMPLVPALAADLPAFERWRALLPAHAGWTLLAGLGLVAVAIAALSVRRPRREPPDDAPPVPIVGSLDSATADDGLLEPEADTFDATAASSSTASASMPNAQADASRAVSSPAPLPPFVSTTPSPPPAAANGSQLFLALHHVDLSIDVLRRHLQDEPRPMPAVWPMLLDLCRTHGREQTFCELALEFHQRFNVRTPAWEGFPPGRDEPGLEAYPRLVKEITLTWGTHECKRLLDRLLYDNRAGRRKGFSLNAYNDLIALRRAADAILETIEEDLAEEAKVRSAFDSASAAADAGSDLADPRSSDRSPLVRDLESQLENDLAAEASQSAIEREHPALAGMLAREWGNAALSARLCEMLARGGDGMQPLSKEAAEELELLRRMAERLAAANGVTLAGIGEAA